ncbi:hypothetical protein PENANT_c122G08086 [Penicillium antarcticum]|uniref:Uncharacterized protein n=1 Tax=Penicillium antarcticum TaxID=416450 RepID=A0A1V6PIN7_9EURO|nr:hypothetical protein PENANT_c122G08086 [Penicillium antarcticum]
MREATTREDNYMGRGSLYWYVVATIGRIE